MRTQRAATLLACVLLSALPGGCIQANWASVNREMSDERLSEVFSKRLQYGMTEMKAAAGLKKMWVQSPDGPWVGTVLMERQRSESELAVFEWTPGANKGFPVRATPWGAFNNRDIVSRAALTIRLKEPGVIVYAMKFKSGECVSLIFDEKGRLSDLVRFEAQPMGNNIEEPPRLIPLTSEPVP